MATHRNEGDAIEGAKIVGTARRVDGPTVERGSGSHRTNRVVLRREAYAVIAMPLKARSKKKAAVRPPKR